MKKNFSPRRGQILKKLRKEKGLTQEELAQKLRLSRPAIAKFEKGETMSINTAVQIAGFFNVGYSFLDDGVIEFEVNIKKALSPDNHKLTLVQRLDYLEELMIRHDREYRERITDLELRLEAMLEGRRQDE